MHVLPLYVCATIKLVFVVSCFYNESRFSWVTTSGHVSPSFCCFSRLENHTEIENNERLEKRLCWLLLHSAVMNIFYKLSKGAFTLRSRTCIWYIKMNQRTTVNCKRTRTNVHLYHSFAFAAVMQMHFKMHLYFSKAHTVVSVCTSKYSRVVIPYKILKGIDGQFKYAT